jgi:hypothetical protein
MFESIYDHFMHNNQINFCLVLFSEAKKKHFQQMLENRVNHTNKNKNNIFTYVDFLKLFSVRPF